MLPSQCYPITRGGMGLRLRKVYSGWGLRQPKHKLDPAHCDPCARDEWAELYGRAHKGAFRMEGLH